MKKIVVSIVADDIPEYNELFTVSLRSPTGGARLSPSYTNATLTIKENDSPIRFSQSQYRADESNGGINITITRGLLEDGSRIGPINVATTVVLSTLTLNGTASPGQDYDSVEEIISFGANVTTITKLINITDDTEQEESEIFWIILSVPGSSAVLYPPFNAMIVIEFSDDPGGVVSFAPPYSVTIAEDAGMGNTTATFTVERTAGAMGDITVTWTVCVVGSECSLAAADFSPPNGTVTIMDGESQVLLTITPFDDNLPEAPEMFMIMLSEVVDGLGRIGRANESLVTVTVRDSDDAYGRLEWGATNQLRVNPVSYYCYYHDYVNSILSIIYHPGPTEVRLNHCSKWRQ